MFRILTGNFVHIHNYVHVLCVHVGNAVKNVQDVDSVYKAPVNDFILPEKG